MVRSKADIERIKEQIRGLKALLKERYRTNVNGVNDAHIESLEKEIENLERALED